MADDEALIEVKFVENKEPSKIKVLSFLSVSFIVSIILITLASKIPVPNGGLRDILKEKKAREFAQATDEVTIIWYEKGIYQYKTVRAADYGITPSFANNDKFFAVPISNTYHTFHNYSDKIFHVIEYSDGSTIYEEATPESMDETIKPKVYYLKDIKIESTTKK